MNNVEDIAALYKYEYGTFVYSGTLALEVALQASNVHRGDYVILPENVCYQVLLSVVRVGAVPIIVNPKNGLILTVDDIRDTVERYSVKAIIVVHSLGIPAHVKDFKDNFPLITIIEDASQAFEITYSNYPIGSHSDYLITSFGATKPLSLGMGGAVFSRTNDINSLLATNDKESRYKSNTPLPYALPNSITLNVDNAISKSRKHIQRRKVIARNLINLLDSTEIEFWRLHPGDTASWHKFPVWVKSKIDKDIITKLARECNVLIELPHRISLRDLPLAKANNAIIVDYGATRKYQINILTKGNKISLLKIWTKKIKDLKK